MAGKGDERPPGSPLQVSAGKYLGHGMTWALSTLLFLLGGRQLDLWWDTEPIFTLVGAFVGAAAGFWSMYYHLVVEPRRRDTEPEDAKGQ